MTTKTKVMKSGNSQAVRIPKQFRFESAEVEIIPASGGLFLRDPKKTARVLKALRATKEKVA